MSTAPNPSTAQARVMVDELARCGVTDAVLAPGSRSTALALALHDDASIRLHVEIDERSAGFLAVGLARASGRPAVVVTTSGSAVANLHPAVIEADAAAVPMVLLTADRPPELRHTGANQTIDQLKLFGDAVRWFVEVGVAADVDGAVAHWRSTAARLVAEAVGAGGPPGPVHANVAFREPTVPAADDGRRQAAPFTASLDGRPDGAPWIRVRPARRRLNDEALGDLAARLAAAERPVLLAGQPEGVDAGAAGAAAARLAAALDAPLLAEPASGARGPAAVTAAHHLLAAPGFAEAHRPDLVLRVGRVGLSSRVAGWLDSAVPQVLIDGHGRWHDPGRTVAEIVVADVVDTADRLVAALDAREAASGDRAAWAEGWRAAERTARAAIAEHLAGAGADSEPRVAREAAAAVPAGGRLVTASSMPIRDLDLAAAPREDLQVLASRGASGIDGLISTALGVALADGAPTVALAGDLAALHDASGWLLRADAVDLPLVLVVVDNDGGGIFHLLPQATQPGFERVFGTPHGRDLADLARLHGLGFRDAVPAETGAAVSAALADGGRQLVRVRTDRQRGPGDRRGLTDAVVAALEGR